MRTVHWLLLLAFSTGTAAAQITQPARFEVKMKGNDDNFTVVSLESFGLALFRETNDYKQGRHQWQLIVLDTLLQQKLDTLIAVEREYSLMGHEYADGKLLLLYQSGEFTRNKVIHCLVDLSTFTITLTEIKTELELRLTHFSSVGNSILFGGYINNEPAIVMYDLVKQYVQLVPGFMQRNTELFDLRINENGTFNVVLVEKVSGENRRLILRTFTQQCKLLLEDVVDAPDNRTLLSAITSSLHREDLIVAGTWGFRNSTRASGFYISSINPFTDDPPTLTPFGSLRSYLDYLKPRRAQKIKTKTKEALAAGKIYEYTNNVLPYKIVEYNKGYLLLAETYSPVSPLPVSSQQQNQQQTWNPYYPYYNPYYSTYPTSRVYRPITYTDNVSNNAPDIRSYSASLLSITPTGEIENDYSIKLNDVEVHSIQQITDLSFYRNDAVLAYRKDRKIHYKKIAQLSDDAEEGEATIQPKDTLDEIQEEDEDETSIRCWFDNVFYTWGYQTVRNISLKNDKTREVFYVNKVVIQ